MLALLIAAILPQAQAADFTYAELAAQSTKDFYNEQCAECHGSKGISRTERYPNVAGQKKTYLVKALNDYRSNQRSGTITSDIASNLSDEQIQALSVYMSSFACSSR